MLVDSAAHSIWAVCRLLLGCALWACGNYFSPTTALLAAHPTSVAATLRRLPVRLPRYQESVPDTCQPRVRRLTYHTWFWVPRVEVADSVVNRRLRALLTLEQATHERPERLRPMGAPPDSAYAALETASYEVLYQRNCLLSLKQYRSWPGIARPAVDYLTLDLRTGFAVELRQEIRAERRAAFVAACELRLRRALETLLRGPDQELFTADAQYLRQHHFTVDHLAVSTMRLQPHTVELLYQVEFMSGSSFLQQEFGDVTIRFTFAELQPYLRPDSPLRRLVPAAPRR